MKIQLAILCLTFLTLASVQAEALTPREAAMQVAMGGWGDAGESSIVRSPNNGGPYSLRIHWKDNPDSDTSFWFLSWYASARGYGALSLDLLVEDNNGEATLPIYLQESDGDRWVAHLDISPQQKGKWQHYEFPRNRFSFWDLGDKKQNWDDISAIVLEPGGKGGETTFYVDNLILKGPAGTKDLLDPSNLPKPYSQPSPKRNSLNTSDAAGHAIIAGSANFWQNLHNLDSVCGISPSIGISSGGYVGPVKSGPVSRRMAALKRPLMEEHQDGQDFEVELTEQGAWCERWDGETNNKTPGKFDKGHSACLSNPKFIEMNKRRADAILASGINTLTLVDLVWPYWGGRWGYSKADIDAYRRALTGADGGLKLVDQRGTLTISFWDYFRDYSGFTMKPADAGCKTWNDYAPTTENEAWPDRGPKRRNMYLFVTLTHYQWLKFVQEIGLYMESKGGHLWIIPNPEDLANAADYVYAGHLAGLQCNLPEYFGNPLWTEASYRSGGYLSQNVHSGKRLIGPILETNAGGHGKPYYDAEVSYAVAYDLCASMIADVIKNDFLDETPFDVVSNPTNVPQFDRFRDAMSKVHAFDQYKKDRPIPPPSPIAVVTPRNINRYRGDLFYGFGATTTSYDGCLADALAREGFKFDLMDTIGYAPIEGHQMVFWGVPEAPATSIERIRKWLSSSPSHVLVCHSYQPTRRATGLGYCPWISKQDFIENALGGKQWGLPAISKDDAFKGGNISLVKPPFADMFKQGESIQTPGGLYAAKGGKVLLSVSGRPLVSEFRRPGGSRVIYLHYRAGEPDTLALDRRISSALALYSSGERLADSVDSAIIHSYTIPNGSVNIVWDRKTLDAWEFIYDGNRKQRLAYSSPGVESVIRIPVPKKGSYTVYDVFNDSITRVDADRTVDLRSQGAARVSQRDALYGYAVQGSIELRLKGVSCAAYYVLSSGILADKQIAELRKAPIHKLLAAAK